MAGGVKLAHNARVVMPNGRAEAVATIATTERTVMQRVSQGRDLRLLAAMFTQSADCVMTSGEPGGRGS